MATYLHVAPALALALVCGPQRVPWRWGLLGAVLAVMPDADMLLVKLHLDHYGGPYGHRGFSHSLGMALVVGLAGWLLAKAHPDHRHRSGTLGAYLGLCWASHPLLDALLNVGICNAWLWPVHTERLCFAWRPVPMRGVSLFGWARLAQEALWIGLPLMACTLVLWPLRRLAPSR
jgi:inner membrane protein